MFMLKGVLNAAANILEKPFENGKVIQQRYEVEELLGRGSYGTSYLVFDRHKQRFVVLKVLRIHKRIFKSGKIAFEQEQQLLQSLHQPFFPTFFEKGDMEGTPFFTMEYVNGKTFEQLIFQEGKTYSEKEAFQIGHQLLKIMDWLHSHGIVHRDIRIPNVMLVEHELKLIDFGLARQFEGNHHPVIELDHIKKMIAPISDFFALGHFLLFLLYSTYEDDESLPEKSWEEELQLSNAAQRIIRKLLVLDEPYQSCSEVEQDFFTIMGG